MKCRVCRAPAVLDIRRHNAAFCRDHFVKHCAEQVRRSIKDHDMIRSGERVVVAVGSDARSGESIRIAVRPERVLVGTADGSAPEGGSRLEGTIAELVYLGMYTQFHADTAAGRVVSHRLADETGAELEPGAQVVLSWEAEDASVLSSEASADALPV